MSATDLLFIHPLLGPDDGWSGYRVEFAPGEADGQALASLRADPKLGDFDRRHPWFIPALPANSVKCALGERAVTVFPARPPAASAADLEQAEASLRQSRSKVGLAAAPDEKLPATGTWDYLLIGASHARTLPPFALIGQASRTTVVATEVHSYADRHWALDNACTLSTGEFLLTRSSHEKKADSARLNLLELLSLVANDADTSALEAIFKRESKLSYSLLRLVNSAAMSPRSPITSFSQAINLLGRRQLQRWLQLLVYADPNNGQHPNPLLQKAAARGRQLELLASLLNPAPEVDNLEDAAFMIGTFSLLDVLLNMPMAEILQQLPLCDVVHSALATHGGALGQLLRAIHAAERRELGVAAEQLGELGIAGPSLVAAQLDAFSWAAKINPAN